MSPVKMAGNILPALVGIIIVATISSSGVTADGASAIIDYTQVYY